MDTLLPERPRCRHSPHKSLHSGGTSPASRCSFLALPLVTGNQTPDLNNRAQSASTECDHHQHCSRRDHRRDCPCHGAPRTSACGRRNRCLGNRTTDDGKVCRVDWNAKRGGSSTPRWFDGRSDQDWVHERRGHCL